MYWICVQTSLAQDSGSLFLGGKGFVRAPAMVGFCGSLSKLAAKLQLPTILVDAGIWKRVFGGRGNSLQSAGKPAFGFPFE